MKYVPMTDEQMAATGERQVSQTLEGIRRDHIARYEWVNSQLDKSAKIIDAACGVGYGSNILAKAGHTVTGIDISPEAIEYARKHWKHPRVTFAKGDLSDPKNLKKSDACVAFECIEHIKDPKPMLKALRESGSVLFASVPNEAIFPYANYAHHFRHYTKGQFTSLLRECGWNVVEWYGQHGRESEVELNVNGRTLVAKCIAGEYKTAEDLKYIPAEKEKPPGHVAIIGLGPSMAEYTDITKRLGGRHKFCDQVWAMNALGSIIQCDKIFHMDDVRIQEIRAEALPDSNTAAMLEWMKTTTTPIITSRVHPDYPALVPFPLVDVLNEFDTGYFNSTAAYAVAYAIWIGAEKISMFGADFTYPNAHQAEKGRACVEFWLGIASERKIKLLVPKKSTLLDAIHTQAERFYGYDTVELNITQNEQGVIDIEFTERDELPSAAQIEWAYDHDKHPNALMSENPQMDE